MVTSRSKPVTRLNTKKIITKKAAPARPLAFTDVVLSSVSFAGPFRGPLGVEIAACWLKASGLGVGDGAETGGTGRLVIGEDYITPPAVRRITLSPTKLPIRNGCAILKSMSNIHVTINGWREMLARILKGFTAQENVSRDWLVNPATKRRPKIDLFSPEANLAFRFIGLTAKGQGRQSEWEVMEEEQRDQTRQ